MIARFAAAAAAVGVFLGSADAKADPMDPAVERLVVDPKCHATINPNTGRRTGAFGRFNDDPTAMRQLKRDTGSETCKPDHAAFKRLMNQWGAALLPTAMHSARTTGFGGFHFSIEGAFTKIDDSAEYWRLGTQGSRDPNTGQASIANNSPPGMLQVWSAKLRKSFGFGLEVTGAVGFMPDTSILHGGADVRLSLLEGFREGIGGIFPDVAVGGGVRTITGISAFQMTTAAVDVQISKPLPIADSSIITPWVGWQMGWILADSNLIDFTPGTDPVRYCNFDGVNVPGNPDTTREDKTPGADGQPSQQVFDGQPVCAGGSPLDFNNNAVFENARLERQRIMFGANYRYEMVMAGFQFITDIVDPADAQKGGDTTTIVTGPGQTDEVSDSEILADEDRQWTIVLELGTIF